MAPAVAKLMATELGRGEDWIRNEVASFEKLATQYLVRDLTD
jgi:hypothetical protein